MLLLIPHQISLPNTFCTTSTFSSTPPLLLSPPMAPPPTPLPPPDLHSPINGIHFQSGEDRGTHMAEAPKSGENDLYGPSDSDAGSVVDDSDVGTSDSLSSGLGEEEVGEEEEEEETASSPRVLVVVGCRPCLSYFMVEQAAPRCPRCGDGRSLVHFGG